MIKYVLYRNVKNCREKLNYVFCKEILKYVLRRNVKICFTATGKTPKFLERWRKKKDCYTAGVSFSDFYNN